MNGLNANRERERESEDISECTSFHEIDALNVVSEWIQTINSMKWINLQITQWTHKSNLRVIDVLGDDLPNLLIRIQAVRRIRDVPKVPNLSPLVV